MKQNNDETLTNIPCSSEYLMNNFLFVSFPCSKQVVNIIFFLFKFFLVNVLIFNVFVFYIFFFQNKKGT